jgi:transcriptional regulator with XRE-family HTH domain
LQRQAARFPVIAQWVQIFHVFLCTGRNALSTIFPLGGKEKFCLPVYGTLMGVKIANSSPKGRHFIKEWRKARRMTQERLAETIGSTSSSVSRIETGDQPYSQDSLEMIAQALNTTPGKLLTGPPDQKAAPSPETQPINERLLMLTFAAMMERLAGMAKTEADLLAEALLEVARMPQSDLEGTDLPSLARTLASFEMRKVSVPKRQ